MVAYSLQSCWFQRWCISVRWHPEGFLTIFWICACNSKGSSLEDRSFFSPCRALIGGRAPQPQKHRPHRLVQDDRIFQIHSMMMRRDTDRYQWDMLRGRPRKSLHGFKLGRVWGRNVDEICTSSWDQTTCQVSIDIKCSWMLSRGSSIGAQNIEKLM